MGNALVKGGVLGAIVLFVWGFVSHAVLSWHNVNLQRFANEGAVAQALSANAPESGIYASPNPNPPPGVASADWEKTVEAQMKAGPLVFAVFNRQGFEGITKALVIQYLILLVGNLLVTGLVLKTRGLTFGGRVGFVLMAALTAGILIHLPYWNWFGFPLKYTMVQLADLAIGGVLSGIVIAWATKPVGAP